MGRPIRAGERDLITPDDLRATLAAQQTAVVAGDILLIRTGWLQWYRTLDAATRTRYAKQPTSVGLEPSEAMAECLWNLHVSCVAADTPAVEAWPPPMSGMDADARSAAMARANDPAVAAGLFLHLLLLPMLGLPLGEMFDLDALAHDCAKASNWHCVFTSAPLNLLHGVATPPNAMAIR